MNSQLTQSFVGEEFVNRVDDYNEEELNRLLSQSISFPFQPQRDEHSVAVEKTPGEHELIEEEFNEDDLTEEPIDDEVLDLVQEFDDEHLVIDELVGNETIQKSLADQCSQMIQQITYIEQRIRSTHALLRKDIQMMNEINISLKQSVKRLKKIGFK